MGAKEPIAFYVTRQYRDLDLGLVVQGLEIINGNIDDPSGFEIIYYNEGGWSTVSSRALYNELDEWAKEYEVKIKNIFK